MVAATVVVVVVVVVATVVVAAPAGITAKREYLIFFGWIFGLSVCVWVSLIC